MTTTKKISRQIQLQSRPKGKPTLDNFTIAEVEIGNPRKGEILVRNEWLSVDPYMRGRMGENKSYVKPFGIRQAMEGGCVGVVVESHHLEFSEGDHVLGNEGWRDLWISDGSGVEKINTTDTPPQNYLSVLGLTGMTAYVGLMKIGSLKKGDNVFVSAASGAVGSMVCQIAKIHGCRVVGSAGSAEKINWLKETANVDDAFNYHHIDDTSAKLAELFPDGIDVYFDNVGGGHLEAAINHMNDFGRIVCCGMISGYNDEQPAPGPQNLFKIIGKRIRMQGFIVRDHANVQIEFQQKMRNWIKEGKIAWKETVTESLEDAPLAFLGLFSGEKMGKALVKL